MKITTQSINQGKQHIVKIPFVGTFTIDQKNLRKVTDFALSHSAKESRSFIKFFAL